VGASIEILKTAITRLAAFMDRIQTSSLYHTSPRYVLDQPDFMNLVVAGFTKLLPADLLKETQEIEVSLGRNRSRSRPKGERTLDIDILLYGTTIMDSEQLKIPHPGMLERAFVLVPLLELSPDLVDPVSGTPFAEALPGVKDQGIYLHDQAVL
jgi:2-amino-4-hydroxy-6-hydroxymethyldihydropteridine diphosphokinase